MATARKGSRPQAQALRAPLPADATTPASTPRLRVRAIATGYYGEKRRRVDDVFLISGRTHPKTGAVVEFSDKWMELVSGGVPLRETSSPTALKRAQDDLKPWKQAATAEDPLGVGIDAD